MNKKLLVLMLTAAIASSICLCACGGDKNKPAATTAGATTAATSAAETQGQATEATPAESKSNDQASANADGIPKEGDMYKGKKVGSVEKVPDCDDDKHGVYYIYDENEELIEAIKY